MTDLPPPHPALAWCRALQTVASLQQSNLDTGLCFLRVGFGPMLRLHVRWSVSPVREFEVPIDVTQDELGGRLAAMGPVAVAWAPPGESLWLPEPGSSPMRVYAFFLDTLGALPSVWTHYAERPFVLREITTDGAKYADVWHTDVEAQQVLVLRIPLTELVEPGVGLRIIDTLTDAERSRVRVNTGAPDGLPVYRLS